MQQRSAPSRKVKGTVVEVLPTTGLAYLADDNQAHWAVTRSTRGIGLDALRPGQRLDLTVKDFADFAVVTEYGPSD